MPTKEWVHNTHMWYNEHTKDMISPAQWRKEHLSIIWPSRASFNTYEIYDWTDIERFETLKEAQDFWDALIKNKREIRYEETITTCYRDEYDSKSTVPEDYN